MQIRSHKNGQEENIKETRQKNVWETSVQDGGGTVVLYFRTYLISLRFQYSIYSILHLADSSCDWIHKLLKNKDDVLFMTPRQNNHSRAKVLWILRSLPLIVAVKYWCYVWEIKQMIGGERCHFCNFISVAQRCVLVINWCSCFEEVLLKTTYSCYSCAQRDWSSWIKGLENVLSLLSFDTLS